MAEPGRGLEESFTSSVAKGKPGWLRAMPGHVHMVPSISPRRSVFSELGYLKGVSHLTHRGMERVRRGFTGRHFWAKGYFPALLAWVRK